MTASLPFPLDQDKALRARLVALARRWMPVAADAEDLVHDAYLRVAGGDLPPPEAHEAWLVTVLRNLCIDVLRREARYRAILGQQTGDAMPAADIDGPAALAERAELTERLLAHLVASLPAGDVAIVLLHEVFDIGHARLGELSGRTATASRQHLHRLLRRIATDEDGLRVDDGDDESDLVALCHLALLRHDPAGLIAVLRISSPTTLACMALGNAGVTA